MSTSETQAGSVPSPLAMLRRSAGWLIVEGMILVVLGFVALGYGFWMTLATVMFLGWILIAGGVISAVSSFWRKEWSGFFVGLISGILYFAVGLLIAASPVLAAETLTLMIALFLIFGGLFGAVAALATLPPHWGWVLLNGVVSLILGVMIWRHWPVTGLWVIGFFVALEMMFNGWALLMLGLAAKRMPKPAGE